MTLTPAERMALWTTPAAELDRAEDQRPATAWRTRGRGAQWTRPGLPARLALSFSDWSWPEFSYGPATVTRRVWRSPSHWDTDAYYPTPGSPTKRGPVTMPWQSNWTTATAEDAGVLVTRRDDPRSGFEALNLRPANGVDRFLIDWAMALSGSWLRTADGDMIADALSFRTPANAGLYRGRGSGDTPKRTGVVTAAEVESGDIGHVLAATGLTQFGPGATIGPMATQVEHPTTAPKGYPVGLLPGAQPVTVCPAGTRLVLPMTDAEITAWLRKRNHNGVRADTAATFVRALGRWGWCHGAETGVGDPVIETTGARGEDAARWRALGIDSATVAATLLDGLPWERVEVRE